METSISAPPSTIAASLFGVYLVSTIHFTSLGVNKHVRSIEDAIMNTERALLVLRNDHKVDSALIGDAESVVRDLNGLVFTLFVAIQKCYEEDVNEKMRMALVDNAALEKMKQENKKKEEDIKRKVERIKIGV
jgi:hypothetical protein